MRISNYQINEFVKDVLREEFTANPYNLIFIVWPASRRLVASPPRLVEAGRGGLVIGEGMV